jgi:glycerol uptake facilitator-like aquaporin
LFFGICFSGRLTGGHLNPAVTLTFILKRDSDVNWKNGLLYMASQCIGALLGASCSSLFTSFVTAPLITPGTDLHIFV